MHCPGGLMVIATINRTLLSLLGAIARAEYVLGWLPRSNHHWSKLPKPDELTALLTAESLEGTAKTGVHVNPLTRKFKFDRSSAINDLLTVLKPG